MKRYAPLVLLLTLCPLALAMENALSQSRLGENQINDAIVGIDSKKKVNRRKYPTLHPTRQSKAQAPERARGGITIPEAIEGKSKNFRDFNPTARNTLVLATRWREREMTFERRKEIGVTRDEPLTEKRKAEELSKIPTVKTLLDDSRLDEAMETYAAKTEIEKEAVEFAYIFQQPEQEDTLKKKITEIAQKHLGIDQNIALPIQQSSNSAPVTRELNPFSATSSVDPAEQKTEENKKQELYTPISSPAPLIAQLEHQAELMAPKSTYIPCPKLTESKEEDGEEEIDINKAYIHISRPALPSNKAEPKQVPSITEETHEPSIENAASSLPQSAIVEPQASDQPVVELPEESSNAISSNHVEEIVNANPAQDIPQNPQPVITDTNSAQPTASSTSLATGSTGTQPLTTTTPQTNQSSEQPTSTPPTPGATGPETNTPTSTNTSSTSTPGSNTDKPSLEKPRTPGKKLKKEKTTPTKQASFFLPRKFIALGILGLTVATFLAYKKFYMTSKQQELAPAA